MNADDWKHFYSIKSSQSEVHESLETVVTKHQQSDFQYPVNDLQKQLYASVFDRISAPVILDCGCGTGMSTDILAQRYPDHVVVGIDQSACRLSRHPQFDVNGDDKAIWVDNKVLVQADVVSWWLLAAREGRQFSKAFFLYPNPWPKSKHLQRRWQGHGIWPLICEHVKYIEMRTNWEVYAKEWRAALEFCRRKGEMSMYEGQPETRFETKYQQSGITCFKVISV